ncbi:hypothetical protein [Chroococcidiopsis sp. SAG 2025]|uniref:hypothetical protein n=1 Tax=Chroococcidiopsis sp. SAG 2025 TaxID=171389 RepID=UPI0029374054|nr:hypothetical protein [Chroococcidiopsis sp. SAG 2025]
MTASRLNSKSDLLLSHQCRISRNWRSPLLATFCHQAIGCVSVREASRREA